MVLWDRVRSCLVGYALVLGVVAFIVGVVLLLMVFLPPSEKDYSFATLRTKHGYMFEFWATNPQFDAMTQSIACRVMKDGAEVIPFVWLGTTPLLELHFALVTDGEDHDMIALIEQAAPHIVVAIYDLKNRTSLFPSGTQEDDIVVKEFLHCLNKDHPVQPYVLLEKHGKNLNPSKLYRN